MKNLNLLAIAAVILTVLILPIGATQAYSIDPRSCGDPKLPFPSAPPCLK
ncbi:hypothetical protein Pse7367_1102 [Thalassoporum mexicanum PCC 7367]|nr:hypothetical protein [Pseudanabaena sp. PCC 7367]AFY69399.1 hypothetical protein Pse7367_1102 [Pseudanabaena sp. PCC 7367]